jgi:predicted DNA-binding transcriptional regulator YafY
MKLAQAFAVLSRMPVTESEAADIQTLCRRVGGGMSVRTMQRYMEQLSAVDPDHPLAPLVRRLEGPPPRHPKGSPDSPPGKAYRYCLDTSALRHWFMTDQMALNLILADQLVGSSLGAAQRIAGKGLAAEAGEFIRRKAQEARRISAYVRIVPDGIGRRPARLDPDLVDTVLEAIARERQLQFAYASRSGKPKNWELSPRGLVAKDGTLYLIGTTGLTDTPVTFALHRARSAQVLPQPIPPRDFNVDQYLERTQNLSHPFGSGESVEMELRVAPDMLYHFEERPLWQQDIGAADADGWTRVRARLPQGVLLVPFLLSLAPGVEVLAPAALRQAIGARIIEAANQYRS